MSSKAARSRAARASLLWNSLPSKKPQGQQCSHGNGWPHTSLMNNAVSTPAIKREANCTPRASTFSTWWIHKYQHIFQQHRQEESSEHIKSVCVWMLQLFLLLVRSKANIKKSVMKWGVTLSSWSWSGSYSWLETAWARKASSSCLWRILPPGHCIIYLRQNKNESCYRERNLSSSILMPKT